MVDLENSGSCAPGRCTVASKVKKPVCSEREDEQFRMRSKDNTSSICLIANQAQFTQAHVGARYAALAEGKKMPMQRPPSTES